MNKGKLINLLLVFTSLFGYLEWGQGSKTFLFQAEWDILQKMFINPKEYLHPFILIPFAGQLLLLFSLFQKHPKAIITFLAIAFIGLLYLMILFIGLISRNFTIIISTLPFLIIAIFRVVRRKWVAAS